MRETTLGTPRPEEEEEELQAPKQTCPCSPWRGPWRSSYFPAAPGEDHTRAVVYTAAMEELS